MMLKESEFDAETIWPQLSIDARLPDRTELLRASRDSSVFRLAVGDTTIIAKRCPVATGRIERIVYEAFLPNADVLSPHYYGSAVDADDEYTWLLFEEIHGKPYRPERAAHRAAAARWLAGIHAAADARPAPEGLPERRAGHYRRLLESISRSLLSLEPADDPAHIETFAAVKAHCHALQACWSELESACSGAPATLVHGDLVAHNAFVVSNGGDPAFVAFDWEKAAWGTPAEDLAHIDLRVYRETLGQRRPAQYDTGIEHTAGAGKIFRCLVYLDWLTPDLARGTEQAHEQLALCRSWLDRLMESAPWRT